MRGGSLGAIAPRFLGAGAACLLECCALQGTASPALHGQLFGHTQAFSRQDIATPPWPRHAAIGMA